MERAIDLVAPGRSFDDIMDDSLRIADAACPSPIWSTIAAVDRSADVQEFVGALGRLQPKGASGVLRAGKEHA